MTATAPPRSVNGNRVSFLETRNAFSDLGDPSGILMPECERRLETEILLHQVQIGMAHASAADFY
jgi:hypothetical protein